MEFWMSVTKSYDDINRRLAAGAAVVLTAAEYKDLAESGCSDDELVRQVDLVTVATFAPMCSSGVFLNFGHGTPPIRMETLSLNGVPAYGGVAAVDAYLGATAEHPDKLSYGGGHVIEDLVAGRPVRLTAAGKGTDCYPTRQIDTVITRDNLNEFYFFNPRNVYQNYAAACNSGKTALSTYLGILEPECRTVSYATAGELSPLLNDPGLRSIGVGTPVFLGGSTGFVVAAGTQFNTAVPHDAAGLPKTGARTLALYADASQCQSEWLAAAYVAGYGTSLFLGVGLTIPLLDTGLAAALRIRNRNIPVLIKDFGKAERPVVLESNYEDLRSGHIELAGQTVRTACTSSLHKARQLCVELKRRVLAGSFPVRAPIEALPSQKQFRGLPLSSQLELLAGAGLSAGGALSGDVPAPQGKAGFCQTLCVNCGACAAHCWPGALTIGQPDWTLNYDDELCTACGTCAAACLRGAFRPLAGAPAGAPVSGKPVVAPGNDPIGKDPTGRKAG